jgi:S-DNA-T family DNA segregation ATPase FtsK/SpoIIIE
MAASSRRKPRARRSAPARPTLEQRHWDLIGLGLVAVAVFLSFLVYLGWEGGTAGTALVDGLKDLVGQVHVLAPVALLAAGAILVMRPVLPAVRPFRAAAACLLLSCCLAFAAGTFGLGGIGEAKEDRGGLLGEWLHEGISTLLGDVGAHVIAIFVFLAGVLLLTGASIAGVLKATGDQVTTTSRRVRERAEPVRSAVTTRMRTAREELAELETSEFTAVSRRRERAPGKEDFWSGPERFPDLYGEGGPGPLSPKAPDEPGPAAQSRIEEGMEELSPEPRDGGPAAPSPDEPRLAEDPETDEPGVMRAGPGREVGEDDLTPGGRYRGSVTDSPEFVWTIPDPRFLTRSTGDANRPDTAGQAKTAAQLVEALGHFGVQAQVIGMVAGPHITRYELRLAPGIKVGKVAQLKDDLAYALAASDIRILAPIPGKQAVGVEVPNARRRIVHLGDVLQGAPDGWSPLTVWLGKDVAGRAIGADLAKMPHLLVAGTTGAGKSGCVNAMLASILLRATPHEVRLVLVDPKQVELNHYDSIPHLLTPVITSPKQAAVALQNLVREMEQRYSYMALARTRNLIEMNKVRASRGEPSLPYILCVIDELADLMMVAPADVEDSIIRLAQKARAVGIHLVLATQSPRVDVITGMIKANVPSRIAFAVSSQTDSRVILDQNGAETLLGQGDMLFAPVGSSRLQRIQGAYVDEEQIAELTEQWRRQGEPELRQELLEAPEEEEAADGGADDGFDPDEDPLLGDAIRLVAEMQTASTSMLQRRLRLGYTRAGRLIDMLERRGVISGYEGSKPRQVLIGEGDVPRVLAALEERGGAVAVPDDEDVTDVT